MRRVLATVGEVGRITTIAILIVGVAVGIVVLRGAAPTEQRPPATSGPAARAAAASPAAGGVASPALPAGSKASDTAAPSPSPSPEVTSPPTAPPTASPTAEPTAEPTARRTPKPTPRPEATPRRTPYNGPPTAPPGVTPAPSPEGDIVVRGHLGETLEAGDIRVRVDWVDASVPDGFCRAENGWVLTRYRITIWWKGPQLKMHALSILNAEGGGNCFGADIGAFESGLETDFVVQQVPGKKAISLYFDYPTPSTTVAFKFR